MRSDSVPLRRPGGSGGEAAPTAGRFLVDGEADGEVVFSDMPISFMMGVSSETGVVIDEHHPLLGTPLNGKIVVLPKGRGSCTASAVILELLYLDIAPAALVFRTMEEILLLGVLLAGAMYSKSIPVVLIQDDHVWSLLSTAKRAKITKRGLIIGEEKSPSQQPSIYYALGRPYTKSVATSEADDRMLRGEGCSRASQMAMELIVETASIQGAAELMDVKQAHIDACCTVGQTSLLVPQRLCDLGGRMAVPTTCNSLSVDRQRWMALGMNAKASKFSSEIGDAYLAMGAAMSFTCAPYLLESRPSPGDQIAWGESNAVVYANSVLGARTQKYPDYLDVLISLTGRAPVVGCHLDEGRRPKMIIRVDLFDGDSNPKINEDFDDAIFPLIGYHIGALVGGDIPFVTGLEHTGPDVPDLKAFGAGFATTSSAPMFHIRGVTLEAATVEVPDGLPELVVRRKDLAETWKELNTAGDDAVVELVALGNPHFALEEFPRLIQLIKGKTKKPNVDVFITTNRYIYESAEAVGYLDEVSRFGAKMITDTCWCMIEEPVIPPEAHSIMTNSAKYAHYGPGVLNKAFHFGSLSGCVEAACAGKRAAPDMAPSWLFVERERHVQ